MFCRKSETLIENLLKIKKIFSDKERNVINNLASQSSFSDKPDEAYEKGTNAKEEFYLISCNWCNKAVAFIDEITNKYSMRNVEDLFEINKFITKFVIFENDSRKINNTFGIYPGPINNFCLLSSKDHWYDYDEEHAYSNVFLSKKIIQSQDYYILSKEQWDLVNKLFDNMYEIKRFPYPKSETKSSNMNINELELYSKEVKSKYYKI